MKNYLLEIVLVLAFIFGGYGVYKYITVTKQFAELTTQHNQTVNDLSAAVSTNKSQAATIKQLEADGKTANDLIKKLENRKAEIKVVEKDRLVYIDKATKENPEINQRQLSPVLQGTIDAIQKSRKVER